MDSETFEADRRAIQNIALIDFKIISPFHVGDKVDIELEYATLTAPGTNYFIIYTKYYIGKAQDGIEQDGTSSSIRNSRDSEVEESGSRIEDLQSTRGESACEDGSTMDSSRRTGEEGSSGNS